MSRLTGVFYRQLYPLTSADDSPETQVLVLTSQRSLHLQQRQWVTALLSGTFDWDSLLAAAFEQRVFPLVYWNLSNLFRTLVPPQKLEALQNHFAEAVSGNLKAKAELIRILQAFREAGIGIMPVRGVVLAYLLYEGIWLREFKDLDVLVEDSDFKRAEALLITLGYERSTPIEDNAYNQKLFHVELGIEVELHWGLDAPFVPVVNEDNFYWGKTVPLLLDGLEVQSLPLDNLLMTLCFHGAKHRWSRLKWLCDVNEFVRKFCDEDWTQILAKARQLRMERILLLNLWLVQSLFETALPAVIVEALREDDAVDPIGHYARQWLFHQEDVTFIDQVRGMGFFLFIREHVQDRLPSIRHALQYPKSPIARAILGNIPVRLLFSSLFGWSTKPSTDGKI